MGTVCCARLNETLRSTCAAVSASVPPLARTVRWRSSVAVALPPRPLSEPLLSSALTAVPELILSSLSKSVAVVSPSVMPLQLQYQPHFHHQHQNQPLKRRKRVSGIK